MQGAILVTALILLCAVNATVVFETNLHTPLITAQWLPPQIHLRGTWLSKCESYNSQPAQFSVQSELTICGTSLTLVKHIYSKNPREPNVNVCGQVKKCMHLCGAAGELVMNVTIAADIVNQKQITSRELSLDLHVTSFELDAASGFSSMLPTNCSSGAIAIGSRSIQIADANCGKWWKGGTVYTSLRTSGSSAHHTALIFGDVYYTDPDHQYAGTPGSSPTLRLSLSKHNRLGNDFSPVSDLDNEQCSDENDRTVPKAFTFVDMGPPYAPNTLGDLGTCASVNVSQSLSSVPLLQLIKVSNVASDPSEVLTDFVAGDHANFRSLPNSYLYWPLSSAGLVDWVTRLIGHGSTHKISVDLHLFATLNKLLQCTRGNTTDLVAVFESGDLSTNYAYWVSVNRVSINSDESQLTLDAEPHYYNLQVANNSLLSYSDADEVQSWAVFVSGTALYGDAGHCPSDIWVRLKLQWNIYTNGSSQAGVYRADQITRHAANGGCYGFPSATSASADPAPFGFALGLGPYTPPDLSRVQPQVDELQLVYDSEIAHTLPDSDPRTWNPRDPAVCSSLHGRDHELCAACTICNYQFDGACANNQTDTCLQNCELHLLPDICYTAKPGKLRTVIVDYPHCDDACTQTVTLLTDCLQLPDDPTRRDLFYGMCPYAADDHLLGRYEFDYEVSTPEDDFHVYVKAYPEVPVSSSRNTHPGRLDNLEMEFFAHSTDHWEQHLTTPSFSSVPGRSAQIQFDQVVVLGERFSSELLLNSQVIRITDITVCLVRQSTVGQLNTWLLADNTRTCAKDSQNQFAVMSAHTFLSGGADTGDCFGVGADNQPLTGECVPAAYLPKIGTDANDLTARPGVPMLMCRKELATEFNVSQEFNSNQYIGCDGVGIPANTILGVLGPLGNDQIYIMETSVTIVDLVSNNPTRRRLLAISPPGQPGAPVTFSLVPPTPPAAAASSSTGVANSADDDDDDPDHDGDNDENEGHEGHFWHDNDGWWWWIWLIIILFFILLLLFFCWWCDWLEYMSQQRSRGRRRVSPADSPRGATVRQLSIVTSSSINPHDLSGENIGLVSRQPSSRSNSPWATTGSSLLEDM